MINHRPIFFLLLNQLLRFSSGEMSSFTLPSYKTAALILDTISNNISSLSSSSSDCRITSCIKYKVLMQCASPGFYNVEWNAENKTFSTWVPFDNTPYCYSWKTSYDYNVNATSFSLSVWISDNDKSITVSPNVLTQQFWLLGEYPRVVPNDNNMFVESLGFNNSHWEYQLTGLSTGVYSYSLTISDSIVSLLDCTVRSTSVTVSKTKYYINPLITELPQEITSFNDTVRMFRDPAAPSVAIVTRGAMSIITQDDFRTHSVFQVNGYRGSIEDVAYTSTSIVMLIDQEIIILINSSSSITSPLGIDLFMSGGSSTETAASSSSSSSHDDDKENAPKGKGKKGAKGKERLKGKKVAVEAVIDLEEISEEQDNETREDNEESETNGQSEEERTGDDEMEDEESGSEEEEEELEEEIEEEEEGDLIEEEEEEEEEEEGGNKSILDSLPTDLVTTQDSDDDD